MTSTAANRYSLDEFLQRTEQRDLGQGLFELESERMLEINLNGRVWTKTGAMVAYRGNVKFTREGILEHGVVKMLKRSVTGEGAKLTKLEGQGKVYCADAGKKISLIRLEGQSIVVNGRDLLAFEPAIQWDITMMKKIGAMMAGGIFNVRLTGHGLVAVTTHYDPLTLRVGPGNDVYTDPNATVAWSGDLTPDLKIDMTLKSLFGRGSGESLQMKFAGNGFVIVQPYEEVPVVAAGGGGG